MEWILQIHYFWFRLLNLWFFNPKILLFFHRVGDGELFIAGKWYGDSVSNSFLDFLDMMQILCARCEHTDAASLRLNGRIERFIFGFILVNEYKSAALEVPLVIAQVEKWCVVKWAVRFFVDMRVPIFIVNRFGRTIVDAREKCGVRQVERMLIDCKFIANRLGDFSSNVSIRSQCIFIQESFSFSQFVNVDKWFVFGQGTRM